MQRLITWLKRWFTSLPEPDITAPKQVDNDRYIIGIKLWRW